MMTKISAMVEALRLWVLGLLLRGDEKVSLGVEEPPVVPVEAAPVVKPPTMRAVDAIMALEGCVVGVLHRDLVNLVTARRELAIAQAALAAAEGHVRECTDAETLASGSAEEARRYVTEHEASVLGGEELVRKLEKELLAARDSLPIFDGALTESKRAAESAAESLQSAAASMNEARAARDTAAEAVKKYEDLLQHALEKATAVAKAANDEVFSAAVVANLDGIRK